MKRLFLALGLLLMAAVPAFAQTIDREPKVAARLVAEGPVAPGGEVWVALEEIIRPGWHTYWVNPGDAGNPTTIEWTLPAGWSAGDIHWPRPKRLPVGPLMDYGYEGKLWLLVPLRAPADAKPGQTVTLEAFATWLVCERICIPEEQALSVTVHIGDGPRDAALAKDFSAARALLPTDSPWPVSYAMGTSIDLHVAAPALAQARPTAVEFYPLDAGAIRNPAPQLIGYTDNGLVLRLTPGSKASTLTTLNGVLAITGSDGQVQALKINASQGLVPAAVFTAAAPEGAAADVMPLWIAMAFAALGGLILNIMPCVLPILAMKALALARHAGSERRVVVGETLAYSGGVIVSFLALGAALLLLRAGGEAVGWGFQLQSPIAVAGFALLLFAVGLNLSGVFEVGSVTAGESLTRKGGATGAFFTGVLAVAVGAPCTMPFGAAALGFALTQGAVAAMLVFFALGLGFALPFLILGLVPGALKFVPRPGPWMLRFKQALAFPMYGAAAWLAWVLAVQAGANSLVMLFAAAVTLALAAWLWSVTRDLSSRGRMIGTIAVLLLVIGAGAAVARLEQPEVAQTGEAGVGAALPNRETYSAARLEELRAEGRPVLVDATAAWCISCIVNEQTALASEAVKTAFAAKNIVYLVADWTNRNPEGTALLTAHGRAGPPLYLYYAPGSAAPKVLPQILTESIVLEAIAH